MSKTDNMLNVIHSNVKWEKMAKKIYRAFIQKDFQMVHFDVLNSTVVVADGYTSIEENLWYISDDIDRI